MDVAGQRRPGRPEQQRDRHDDATDAALVAPPEVLRPEVVLHQHPGPDPEPERDHRGEHDDVRVGHDRQAATPAPAAGSRRRPCSASGIRWTSIPITNVLMPAAAASSAVAYEIRCASRPRSMKPGCGGRRRCSSPAHQPEHEDQLPERRRPDRLGAGPGVLVLVRRRHGAYAGRPTRPAARAPSAARPSGSSPMSSGWRRMKISDIGTIRPAPMTPRTTQAIRQPTSSIKTWVSGTSRKPPSGTPSEAYAIARPRFAHEPLGDRDGRDQRARAVHPDQAHHREERHDLPAVGRPAPGRPSRRRRAAPRPPA